MILGTTITKNCIAAIPHQPAQTQKTKQEIEIAVVNEIFLSLENAVFAPLKSLSLFSLGTVLKEIATRIIPRIVIKIVTINVKSVQAVRRFPATLLPLYARKMRTGETRGTMYLGTVIFMVYFSEIYGFVKKKREKNFSSPPIFTRF